MMKYAVGINSNIIGKPEPSTPPTARGWSDDEVSLEEFIDHVTRHGYAFSAHFKNGHRNTQNFIRAGFVAADVDGGMTLEQALAYPFVQERAGLLYTTPSHTPVNHRYRIVFPVEKPFTTAADWSNSNLGLAIKLGTDRSVTDGARQFYGNPGAKVIHLGGSLKQADVDSLARMGAEQRKRLREVSLSTMPIRAADRLARDQVVAHRDGRYIILDDLPHGESIHCPFHNDKRASAFVVRGRHGGLGIHCRSCLASFWAEEPKEYDFESFERLIAERRGYDDRAAPAVKGVFEQRFPPQPSITEYEQRYLPPIPYRPGVTLVRSPKGSGKTEALKDLIATVKAGIQSSRLKEGDIPKSVLLIGHRQVLLQEAAAKMSLAFYLDQNTKEEQRVQAFAVCLDSLPKAIERREWRGDAKDDPYDLVIIDESEQVFSHLFSGTISEGDRDKVFHALDFFLRNAKAIYALDADLGLVTAHVLSVLRKKDWERSCRIVYNRPLVPAERRTLRLFAKKRRLEEELFREITRGKRCFVASNSKRYVEGLQEAIRAKFGRKVKVRCVTSSNSRDQEVIEFTKNIREEFLKIDVLLSSPSLGTGIDITFPNGRCEVDHVFGFFFPFVNTHSDIDQQLSRVRNPGAVSVWISPAEFHYETSFDVVRHDLARAYWVPSACKGLDEDGRVVYDAENPLLLIASHVACYQRASKRRLLPLFCELRERNGWEIEHVAQKHSKDTPDLVKEGKRVAWERMIKRIMDAYDIDVIERDELWQRQNKGGHLSPLDRALLARAEYKRAIKAPLSPDVLRLDMDGKLIERVEAFSYLFTNPTKFQDIRDALDRAASRDFVLRKVPLPFLIGQLLLTAGLIDDSGRFRRDAVLLSTDLQHFAAVCRHNRTMIEELMQFTMRRSVAGNPIGQLNDFLKRLGLVFVKGERRKHNKKAKNDYRLDGVKWDIMCYLSGVSVD